MSLLDVHRALQWLRNRRAKPLHVATPVEQVKTKFSNTIFHGEAREWVNYLKSRREDRYLRDLRIAVLWDGHRGLLLFRPETPDSRELARRVNESFGIARSRAAERTHVDALFQEVVFGNRTNQEAALNLVVSATLPCDATREVLLSSPQSAAEINIVLGATLVETVLAQFQSLGREPSPDEVLGLSWPILQRVLSQLGQSTYPRDRFIERIDLTARVAMLSVNLLYDGKESGRLKPNRAGELFETYVCRREGFKGDELFDRHPYLRLLNELSFAMTEDGCRNASGVARVLVREFLDEHYLRLSLAGTMPPVVEAMRPMPFEREQHVVHLPAPEIGKYGILDAEDLQSWKQVAKPFDEMGYSLIRQLGIGEFGRVYEAINRENPRLAEHVALKIDRIQATERKKAIAAAEHALQIGQKLSFCPHVIRLYDAGKLKGKSYTYHILQLIDGDTLDRLVGVAGVEHASFHGSRSAIRSHEQVKREYLESMHGSKGEGWRGKRWSLPFTENLTLSQCLDLITSILLWVEEVHGLGYVVNDLKNGNLMVSRRGQLKGIDLDSYAPANAPLDRMHDFYFLSVSLVLLIMNACDPRSRPRVVGEDLLQSSKELARFLTQGWPYGDVSVISGGRVQTREVVEVILNLVSRCRDHTYAEDPARFSEDTDRFIALKQAVFLEEVILD